MVLRNVQFEHPLFLSYGAVRKVILSFEDAPENDDAAFSIYAEVDGKRETYCHGLVGSAGELINCVVIKDVFDRMVSELSIGTFYGELRKSGLEYGSSFSTVRQLRIGPRGSGEAIGHITPTPHEEEDPHSFTFTTMLDGCLQVCGAGFQSLENIDSQMAFIPVSIQSVTMHRPLPRQAWSHVIVRTTAGGQAVLAHIRVLNDEGEVLIDLDGLELRIKNALTTPVDHDGTPEQQNTAMPTPWKSGRNDLVAKLQPLSNDERLLVVAEWLTTEVTDTLGQAAEDLDIEDLDPSAAFIEIGLDSLLVTELQRRIQERLDFRFKSMEALDYQSIESLAEFILKNVLVIEPADAAPKAVTSAG